MNNKPVKWILEGNGPARRSWEIEMMNKKESPEQRFKSMYMGEWETPEPCPLRAKKLRKIIFDIFKHGVSCGDWALSEWEIKYVHDHTWPYRDFIPTFKGRLMRPNEMKEWEEWKKKYPI